jgi:hypothetical protein
MTTNNTIVLSTYAEFTEVVKYLTVYTGKLPLKNGDNLDMADVQRTMYIGGEPARKLKASDTLKPTGTVYTYMTKKDKEKSTVSRYAKQSDITSTKFKSETDKKLKAIIDRFMAGEITSDEMAQETTAVKAHALTL